MKLSKKYGPLISDLIDNNIKYYDINQTIKWAFCYNEDIAIMGGCDRKTNLITLNMASLLYAIEKNDLKTIEYYLLHEMRHLYQHLIIKDYKDGKDIPIEKDIIERWIKNGENYIQSCDEDGNEIKEYYYQDTEIDAYLYALAIMKHKYKDIELACVPSCYDNDFYNKVNDLINKFNDEII